MLVLSGSGSVAAIVLGQVLRGGCTEIGNVSTRVGCSVPCPIGPLCPLLSLCTPRLGYQLGCNLIEQSFHVVRLLCRRLQEVHVVLLGELLSYVSGHLAIISIRFVAHQDLKDL